MILGVALRLSIYYAIDDKFQQQPVILNLTEASISIWEKLSYAIIR